MANLQYYILAEVASCLFSLILVVNMAANFIPHERKCRLFLYGGVCSVINTAFNCLAVFCISYYQSVPIFLSTLISTIFFITLLGIPLILCDYAIEISLPYDKVRSVLACVNGSLYSLFLILVFINLKTGWIFRYDPDLGYIRGPLKYLSYILTLIYSIEALCVVIDNHKTMPKRIYIVFLMYPVVSFSIIAVQFFFQKILLSGCASFTALMFAYITLQTDKKEFDSITGLMTGHVFKNHIELRKKNAVILYIIIENYENLQRSMETQEFNLMILEFGRMFKKTRPQNSYNINSNTFVNILENREEAEKVYENVSDYIKILNDANRGKVSAVDFYSIALDFVPGEASTLNLKDIVNNIHKKALFDQNHNLIFSDESVLLNLERKHKICSILKRELNLESEQFQVWYQPIYSLKENKFKYMEALSRLNDTELGNISPGEFIAVAEDQGLIEQLGFVAFEKVCKYISENRDVVHAVSINFSVYQMLNPDIVKNVLSTIERFKLSTSNIIMEITESIFIDNYETVLKNMTDLSNAGIKFYLDDFGTGYSNLANVITLPFSTIKIDRSLVLKTEESESNTLFFYNIVSTFKDAGLNVLVEGVETQNQNVTVQQAGADYIQGFLFSRPLPPEKCLELLKRGI